MVSFLGWCNYARYKYPLPVRFHTRAVKMVNRSQELPFHSRCVCSHLMYLHREKSYIPSSERRKGLKQYSIKPGECMNEKCECSWPAFSPVLTTVKSFDLMPKIAIKGKKSRATIARRKK